MRSFIFAVLIFGSSAARAACPMVSESDGVANVVHWGASPSYGNDDQEALQCAMDYLLTTYGGGVMYFPPGSYRGSLAVGARGGRISFRGAGSHLSELEALNAGEWAITVQPVGNASMGWRPSTYEGMKISGALNTRNGIRVGWDDSGASEVSGGLVFRDFVFEYCDTAFHKIGSLWNTFYSTTFMGNNVGYKAVSGTIMHAGLDAFYSSSIRQNTLGILIEGDPNGTQHGLQTIFVGCEIENNGTGMYVHGQATKRYSPPLVVRDTWFEVNSAADMVLEHVGNAHLENVSGYKFVFSNSHVLTANMSMIGTTPVLSTNSIVRHVDPVTRYSKGTHLNSYVTRGRISTEPTSGLSYRTPSRDGYYDPKCNEIKPEDQFAMFDLVSGSSHCNGNVCSTVVDRSGGKSYGQITLGPNQIMSDGVHYWGFEAMPGEFVVFSFALKSSSGAESVHGKIVGDYEAHRMYGIELSERWATYSGVFATGPVAGGLELYLWNPGDSMVSVNIKAVQVVRFGSEIEALEFLHGNGFAGN